MAAMQPCPLWYILGHFEACDKAAWLSISYTSSLSALERCEALLLSAYRQTNMPLRTCTCTVSAEHM